MFIALAQDVQNPYDSYVSSGHSATELVATASGVQSPVIDLNRASEIPLTSSAGDLIDSLPSLDENGAEDPVLHSVSKGLDHGNLMIVTRDFQTVSQAVQLADQRPEQNGTIDHFINESQSHQSFGEKFSVREINELFASQLSVSVPGNTLADQVTRERVTLDSVTDLRLKVSRASSKSSETWPFPPSDKELNVLGQPDNIPLRKNDEDTLSAKVNVIEDRAEVDGSPSSGAIPKAAKMKYGISEKMFPHATMLDDLDNMQRFK
jgi:hypothetical protein